jgi:hypothetical protein
MVESRNPVAKFPSHSRRRAEAREPRSCSISLCYCRLESKRGRIGSRVKYWRISMAIVAALSTSLAVADDFKTINGKEYKDATVSRVEADGIFLKTKLGISKVYFTERPKEVQQRFNYDPEKAAAYSANQNAALEQAESSKSKQHRRRLRWRSRYGTGRVLTLRLPASEHITNHELERQRKLVIRSSQTNLGN